jgi:hypothetical protein
MEHQQHDATFVPLLSCNVTSITLKIIIIWHYNPLWVFASSAMSLQVLQFLTISFQFLTFSFFRSSITSSCHHCLGLLTGSFLVGLAWSIL